MSLLTEPPLAVLSVIPSVPCLLPDPRPRVQSALPILPLDVLERIVRHLSATPRSPHWACNVPPLAIHGLFLAGGPFASLAATHFGQLTTTSGPWPSYAPPAARGGVVAVSNHAEAAFFASMLRSAGGALTALTVAHAPHYASWIDTAAIHSTRLSSLSVAVAPELECRLEALLAARGPQLHTLKLSCSNLSSSLAYAVRAYCSRLTSLTLDLEELAPDVLAPLLRGLGPRLEALALHAPESPSCAVTLAAVGSSCVALKDLSLRCGGQSPLATVTLALLALRAGARLRHLRLGAGMASAALLARVATHCPAARFDVDAVGAEAGETLAAVDGRARALTLSAAPPPAGRTWDCRRLERLVVDRPGCDVAATLRALRGRHGRHGLRALRDAVVRVWGTGAAGVVEARAALDVLAGASALQKLFFAAPWLPPGVFDDVAAGNASLTDVTVSFSGLMAAQRRAHDLSGRTGKVLGSVVAAFGRCKDMQSIFVKDVSSASRTRFKDVTAACHLLRARDVAVLVCGVQYLR